MTTTTESTATPEVLYFAYGSNLSPTQMAQRCPKSAPIALAHLPGWTFLINQRGYANIVKNDAGTSPSSGNAHNTGVPAAADPGVYGVYGVLYKLDAEDEDTLDACEGVPWAYEKSYVEATKVEGGKGLADGEKVQVLAYVDFKRVLPSTPKSEYVGRMNRGIEEAMKDWNLPKAYVDEVMRPFIPKS